MEENHQGKAQAAEAVNEPSVPTKLKDRSLYVKNVPGTVWARARHNALISEVPFRDYIISLLASSMPLKAASG